MHNTSQPNRTPHTKRENNTIIEEDGRLSEKPAMSLIYEMVIRLHKIYFIRILNR